MRSPKVSVILSIYNCEKFIEESLDSIRVQTFRDFEIIVYEDCSTDKTFELTSNYLSKSCMDYKLIQGHRNIGCGDGRNIAIENCRGDYVAIQDGDDISFLNRLEKEAYYLDENKNVFCVGSWAIKIDGQKKYLGSMEYPPLRSDQVFDEILKGKNPVIDPSCMFRRDMFIRIGGYLTKWKLIPDFYLWARAMFSGYEINNIPFHLVYYRKHKDSVTSKFQAEMIQEHKEMCNAFIRNKGFSNDIMNINR